MFTGEYLHNIDAKGRTIIPVKLRDGLGEVFYATKGLDNCIFVFPQKEFEDFRAKIKELPMANSRDFQRFFFSGAAECEVDKNGRILLPQALRQYASLEKDVVIIGANERVEIWSKEKWDEYNNSPVFSTDAISAQMMSLGI